MNSTPVTLPHDRLIDYFALVGCASDKSLPVYEERRTDSNLLHPLKTSFVPAVLDRFPSGDHSNTPFSTGIASFAFPLNVKLVRCKKVDEPLPTTFRWLATNQTGAACYGHSLVFYQPISPQQTAGLELSIIGDTTGEYGLYIPRAIVLLSKWTLPGFRTILTELFRISLSGTTVPLERILSNLLLEVPLPPAGRLEVHYNIGNTTVVLRRPPPNRRLSPANLCMREAFEALDHDNIITAWTALLIERQVLLVSSQLSLLGAATDVLVSLLYPFRWTHTTIPVLPWQLSEVLSAPMPYLIGVHVDLYRAVQGDLNEGTIIVDLDRNTVVAAAAPAFAAAQASATLPVRLPPLPVKARAKLVRALQAYGDVFSRRGANWVYSRLPTFDSAFTFASRPGEVDIDGEDAGDLDGAPEDAGDVSEEEENKGPENKGKGSRWYGFGRNLSKADPSDSDGTGKAVQWPKVRAAFFRVFTALLLKYREHLIFTPTATSTASASSDGGMKSPTKSGTRSSSEGSESSTPNASRPLAMDSTLQFNKTAFLASAPSDSRPLLAAVLATQLWANFIDDRLSTPGSSGDVSTVIDLEFFDESLDAKLNRSRLAGVLGKRPTPFLSSKEWAVTKTVVALSPDTSHIPGYPYRRFEYHPFPDTLDHSLHMPARAHEVYHDDWQVQHGVAGEDGEQQVEAQVDDGSMVRPSPALDWLTGGRAAGVGGLNVHSLASMSRVALLYSAWFITLAAGLEPAAKIYSARVGMHVEKAIRRARKQRPLPPLAMDVVMDAVTGLATSSTSSSSSASAQDVHLSTSTGDSDGTDITAVTHRRQESVPPVLEHGAAMQEEGDEELTPMEQAQLDAAVNTAKAAFTARALDSGFAVLARMKADLTHRLHMSGAKPVASLAGATALLTYGRHSSHAAVQIPPVDLEIAYRCLLDACGGAGAFSKAYGLLNEMQSIGLAADAGLYRALFAAFFNNRPGTGTSAHGHSKSAPTAAAMAYLDLTPLSIHGGVYLRRSGRYLSPQEASRRRAVVREGRKVARRAERAAQREAEQAAQKRKMSTGAMGQKSSAAAGSSSGASDRSISMTSFLSGSSMVSIAGGSGAARSSSNRRAREGSVAAATTALAPSTPTSSALSRQPSASPPSDATTALKDAVSVYAGSGAGIMAGGRRRRVAGSTGSVPASGGDDGDAEVVPAPLPPKAPSSAAVPPSDAPAPASPPAAPPRSLTATSPSPTASMASLLGFRSSLAPGAREGASKASRPGSVAAADKAKHSFLAPSLSSMGLGLPSWAGGATVEQQDAGVTSDGTPSESTAVIDGLGGGVSGVPAGMTPPIDSPPPPAADSLAEAVEARAREQAAEWAEEDALEDAQIDTETVDEEDIEEAEYGPGAGEAMPFNLPPGLPPALTGWVTALAYAHPAQSGLYGTPTMRDTTFPGLDIDTGRETCPDCGHALSTAQVQAGWSLDPNDYSTTCYACAPVAGGSAVLGKPRRFVARFSVTSSSPTWTGSGGRPGPGSLLFVEYLHPGCLVKELQGALMKGTFGPALHTRAPAVFWNLLLWFADMPGGPLPSDLLEHLSAAPLPVPPYVQPAPSRPVSVQSPGLLSTQHARHSSNHSATEGLSSPSGGVGSAIKGARPRAQSTVLARYHGVAAVITATRAMGQAAADHALAKKSNEQGIDQQGVPGSPSPV